VVAKRNAFLALPNAQNGGEFKGRIKTGGLKSQFSRVEGNLDLQEVPKPVPIPKKSTKEEGSCGER
jgi:hypothetical protein